MLRLRLGKGKAVRLGKAVLGQAWPKAVRVTNKAWPSQDLGKALEALKRIYNSRVGSP